MTVTDYKVWLARNNMTQAQLAEKLGITSNTIGNYVKRERFPRWFLLALITLELRGAQS